MSFGPIRQDNSAFGRLRVLRGHEGTLALAAGMWAGAGGFFASQVELAWFGVTLMLLGAALALGWLGVRQRWLALFLLGAGAAVALAQCEIDRAGGEIDWARLERPVWVTGTLADTYPVASKPGRVWLVLRPATVFQPGHILHEWEVRASVDARRVPGFAPGAGVAAQVLLWPPEGPQAPGKKDFRLWRYLHQESLRGYVQGEVGPAVPPAPESGLWARVTAVFARQQEEISRGLEGAGDGVAAALLVGERKGIPPAVAEAYRRSGLTHLLAISGFQLMVVGGGIYFVLRWFMTLWPWFALHADTRRLAAVVALAAAAGYTLLVGAEVSVVRALVMLALMFAAVLAGRTRSLIRAWAIAVVAVLAVQPSMVTSAGFQLSFAAVLALTVWAAAEPEWRGFMRKIKALAMSSVVAGVATLPVVALNFGQVSLVGVVANMVAVPAMALLTGIGMGVLAAWPLGLAGPLVPIMDFGVGLVNRWAAWMAVWPGANLEIPLWGGWLLLPLCVAFLAVLVCRLWWLSVGVGGAIVSVTVALVSQVDAFACTVTYGGRQTDCPAGMVVRRDEVSPEDCRLAARILVTSDGASGVASACPDRVLAEGRFGWAGRRADGRWTVFVPGTERVWEQ